MRGTWPLVSPSPVIGPPAPGRNRGDDAERGDTPQIVLKSKDVAPAAQLVRSGERDGLDVEGAAGLDLLTRDIGRYRRYFPTVRLIAPNS